MRLGLPRNPGLSFVAVALPIMAALYALIYLTHDQDSLAVRALGVYLVWVAHASALLIGLFDPTVTVSGTHVGGRFPLEIVLDCAALDVQAIFAAAVLAFPAPWRRRIGGVAAGLTLLWLLNITRIACLSLIGWYAPTWFHTMHEEVFQIVVVLGACLVFGAWVFWARPQPTPRLEVEPDLGAV